MTKNDISDEWGKYNAGVALWHVKIETAFQKWSDIWPSMVTHTQN